jgi:hypothetical protein
MAVHDEEPGISLAERHVGMGKIGAERLAALRAELLAFSETIRELGVPGEGAAES